MNVAVVGVGLIGGSIGLALQQRLGASVTGYDPAADVLEEALRRGAIGAATKTISASRAASAALVATAPIAPRRRASSSTSAAGS